MTSSSVGEVNGSRPSVTAARSQEVTAPITITPISRTSPPIAIIVSSRWRRRPVKPAMLRAATIAITLPATISSAGESPSSLQIGAR